MDLVGRGGSIPFQPGACVAFRPAEKWNGRTVFLDPGHGGLDPGGVAALAGRRVEEKRVTLAVASTVSELLRGAGFRVVMSRIADSLVARPGPGDVNGELLSAAGVKNEIEARNLCAEAARASVLVAIHTDASTDPSVSGASTIYCAERPFGRRSARLAALLQRAVLDSLRRSGPSVPDRGVLRDRAVGTPALTAQGAAYGHLLELGPAHPPWFRHPSLMPGAILEPLVLTNPAEARIGLSAQGRLAIARGVVDALETYFRAG